jgi:nitrate reductase NapA
MSQDRRTFLKGVALAAAGSGFAPGALLPARGERVASAATAPVWKKAPCRLCGVGCGLLVAIQNGRAVAVKGDPDSPVSKGLACVKGYHSVQALYARDRITRASIRKNGARADVPLTEAYDVVARRLRETIEAHGKNSVAIYGSGHWTVPDAYVAAKLFRGALGTNNVESSARLYTASAAAGLVSSFGRDGAVGCYDDIDHADVFVLWNHNISETDPLLFSRMLERRRKSPGVRIIDLATRTTRTSYAADRSLLYAPQSELAIVNAICQEIVARRWVQRDFVDRYVAFRRGRTGIGYGLKDDVVGDDAADATLADYVEFLADYTPERSASIAALPAEDIRWLASLYGDRSRKVMSIWGAAVNQHARGAWVNNGIHNIHLLVGKIATEGNTALCTAAQSGGGDTLHDAGALARGLPRGSVERDEDRQLAARIWGVPAQNIGAKPGPTVLALFRAVERGAIRFLWIQATNPLVSLPNLNRYVNAARSGGCFVVVSEAYPTATTDMADVVLPASLWIEREGISGNTGRHVQHHEQLVQPPGDATDDAWQLIEVARRLGYGRLFPWQRNQHIGEIWSEYARFHADPSRRAAALPELRASPGVLWPVVDGRETKWRYNTAHDPAADAKRGDFDFYGHPDHRAWIWLRPHEPPAEATDRAYPFRLAIGRVLEHSGTGTITRRIPTLHRAMPRSYVEINRDDALALGIRNGDTVRLVSRRGSLEIAARVDYRAQPPRGLLFVPVFDEALLVNRLTLDSCCPVSGQPDYGSAVRVERVGARASR